MTAPPVLSWFKTCPTCGYRLRPAFEEHEHQALRPPLPRRALAALNAALADIEAQKGWCSGSALGNLLAAQGLLSGDHELADDATELTP